MSKSFVTLMMSSYAIFPSLVHIENKFPFFVTLDSYCVFKTRFQEWKKYARSKITILVRGTKIFIWHMVWEDGRQGGAPLMLPHKSLLLINVEKL